METDLSNPQATAYFYTVEDAAVEMTVQPQAVFADMTIQGTLSGQPGPAPSEGTGNGAAVASAGVGIDPKWISLIALAVIVIGAVALINSER